MTINSQIDGEFVGTENETVFKLTNGQIWQQIGYRYRYAYRYRPRVTVSGARHNAQMVVDGFGEAIKVRQIG